MTKRNKERKKQRKELKKQEKKKNKFAHWSSVTGLHPGGKKEHDRAARRRGEERLQEKEEEFDIESLPRYAVVVKEEDGAYWRYKGYRAVSNKGGFSSGLSRIEAGVIAYQFAIMSPNLPLWETRHVLVPLGDSGFYVEVYSHPDFDWGTEYVISLPEVLEGTPGATSSRSGYDYLAGRFKHYGKTDDSSRIISFRGLELEVQEIDIEQEESKRPRRLKWADDEAVY